MAEENSTRNNIILVVLLLLNMVAISLFGMYLFRQHKSAETAEKQKATTAAEKSPTPSTADKAPEKVEAPVENSYTRKVVKFESLITNLAGDQGRRVVRLSLEARCEGDSVLAELTSLKPRVRDIIVGEVGNNTAEDLSSNEGKEKFKIQLREDINAVLKKGKITEVYITDLQLN